MSTDGPTNDSTSLTGGQVSMEAIGIKLATRGCNYHAAAATCSFLGNSCDVAFALNSILMVFDSQDI